MGGKGREGEGEEKEERGKEGKGEGCVMAFGEWTPLEDYDDNDARSATTADQYHIVPIQR